MDIKQKLLSLDIFNDNEYFKSYVELITNNIERKPIIHQTQRHHIIPKYYFKKNNLKCDNSKYNIVNLYYKDHIIAHYFLSHCCKNEEERLSNILALQYMLNDKNFNSLDLTDEFLEKVQQLYLELYSKKGCPLKDENIYKHFLEKVQSKENREKISKTMKEKAKNNQLFTQEHKEKLSEKAKGHIWVHKDGIYTHIDSQKLEEYLLNGWEKGARPLSVEHQQAILKAKIGHKYTKEQKEKLRISHLGQVAWNKGIPCPQHTKDKLSNYFKGTRWMNNGISNKQVSANKIEEYKALGYVFGRKVIK